MTRVTVVALPLMQNKWLFGGLAGFIVLVGILTWVFWPAGDTPEPPRAREYKAETACLLTDEKGITDPAVAPVWASMQNWSAKSLVKVQYLSVLGPQTVENAQTFVASQAQGGCDVIMAIGETQLKAVEKSAATFPNRKFVLVGGTATAPNVSHVEPDAVGSYLSANFK